MTAEADITPEQLRQLIRYESEGGKAYWRRRPDEMFLTSRDCKWWNNRFADKEISPTPSAYGYRRICVFYRQLLLHRAIWAMHYGSWPTGQIDHINGDRCDNRLLNLRDVTQAENSKNQRPRITNTSGHTGVNWDGKIKKWVASIANNGRKKHLGVFHSKEDAIASRKAAEKKFGYHANHGTVIQ